MEDDGDADREAANSRICGFNLSELRIFVMSCGSAEERASNI